MKNTSSLLPDPVHMPVRDSLKLNAWAGIAVVMAFVSRLMLASPDWSPWARCVVALLPVLPGLLYVRALWRWMSGLDELQRRIQLEAVCFATLAMLLLALAADLLRGAGVGSRLNLGWEGFFAITFGLYALGLIRVHRRYR